LRTKIETAPRRTPALPISGSQLVLCEEPEPPRPQNQSPHTCRDAPRVTSHGSRACPPWRVTLLLIVNMIIRIAAKSFAFFTKFISNRQFSVCSRSDRFGSSPDQRSVTGLALSPPSLDLSVFIRVHPWILIGLFSAPMPLATAATGGPNEATLA
jgi:hypothetical protein